MDWMHFWTVLGQLAIAVVGLSVPLAFGAGLIASSGGVSRSDTASAASTTMPTTASRSSVVANR